MEKNNKNKVLNLSAILTSSILATSIVIAPFAKPINVFADNLNGIQLTVNQKQKVDVVLTLGRTVIDAQNFKNDLNRKLTQRGIDADIVNISSLKSAEINAKSNFSWVKYDHEGYNDGNVGIYHHVNISPDGRVMDFYGYGRRPLKDFIFMNDENPTKKTFELTIDEVNTDWHTLEGAGFFLGANLQNNLFNGYSVIFAQSGIELYELKNMNINQFYESNSDRMSSYGSKIATGSKNGRRHNLKIESTPSNVKLWDNGNLIINKNLSNYYGMGFGPMVSYTSHNCSSLSHIQFSNLTMKTLDAKKFTEVVRQPEWQKNSSRFLVNLDDKEISDFNNDADCSEILSRLIGNDIHYIGLGTNENESQANNFISKNNGNGAFFDNRDYEGSLNKLADYISSHLKKNLNQDDDNDDDVSEGSGSSSIDGDKQYVLIGEKVYFTANPSNLLKNTADSNYPNGKWKLNHNYNYFDNSLGQADFDGQYRSDLVNKFYKPGRYDIFFEKNQHPTPRYIYAHRRPIANFNFNLVPNGNGTFSVTTQDMSYDPDLQFKDSDRGISKRKWKWKEVHETNWHIGEIPALQANKDYIVELKVKDKQNAWSEPTAKYITTKNVSTKPVASFDVLESKITKFEPLNIIDTSYDPSGKPITNHNWAIYKDKQQVYSSSTLPTDFRNLGAGDYVIGLKVCNSYGIWADEYKVPVQVIEDTYAPEATVDVVNHDWTKNAIDVSINFTDKGGSGVDSYSYVVSSSSNPPSSGWSSWQKGTDLKIKIQNDGVNYIHLKAKDGAGNLMTRTLGEYKIDKSNPTVKATPEKTSWVKGSLKINVVATDSNSGIKRIQLPDGNFVYSNNTVFSACENGKYIFRAEDNLYNRGEISINVNNIDNTAPDLTLTKDTELFVNSKIIINASAKDSQSGVKRIKLPDGTWVSSNNAKFQVNTNGTYKFESEDNVGNISTKSIVISTIDKTPPKPPIPNIPDIDTSHWSNNPSIKINPKGNGDDGGGNVSKIQYRVIDKETNEVKQDWTDVIPGDSEVKMDGKLKIEFRAIDDAGNISETTSKTVMRDTKGPDVKIKTNSKGLTNKDIVLTVESIDNLSGFKKIKLPNGNWVTSSKVDYTVSKNGEYEFEAEDALGNRTKIKYLVRNIKKNPLITNNPSVVLNLKAKDYLSGMSKMRFKNEEGNWTGYEAFNNRKNWILTSENGLKHVWVQYMDNAGNSTNPIEDIIILDTIDSVVDKFVVNEGKYYVNKLTIPVEVHATDNLTGVKNLLVSNDKKNWTTIPYSEKFDWTLPSGDGEKTVYVKVEDVAGNISKSYNQKVYLDMTKPKASILINNGDEYTATRNVNLKLNFSDKESGVAKVIVIEGDKSYEFPNVPQDGVVIPWTLDFGVNKTVCLKVVDKAGNVSDIASDSIIVDKLTIKNFTLTNVVNPLDFKSNSFKPLVWDFAPQPMMAGANISFALNIKAPYERDVVEDSATYKVEIVGDNGYHKVIANPFKDVVNDSYRATITIPIDAPKGAKIYVSSIATRKLLVSPFDIQTAYFPGPDTSTKAQIGVIKGNIQKAIKFNETR